jgi:hypothetical protein
MPNTIASRLPERLAPPRQALRDLAALALMLAEGWRIESPVLARLAWAPRRAGELSYHVILARASQRSLVVIAESPEVHCFLAEHDIPVV